MSATLVRLHVSRLNASSLGVSIGVAGGCLATASALALVGPGPALVLALAPLAVLFLATPRALLCGVVVVLAATVAFGRDFAYLQVGGPYILDLTLLVALVTAAPSAASALARRPALAVSVLGIVCVAGAHLVVAGFREETVRQSVLGFYALWAVVGLFIAQGGFVRRFASVVYVASIVTTAAYALFQVAPDNTFTLVVTPRFINAAGSLYVGYSVLLVLFARPSVPKFVGPLAVSAVLAIQIVEIGAAGVRSIWVALPAAIVATIALGGLDRSLVRRLQFAALPLALVALSLPFIFPAAASRIVTEAGSIVGIETGSFSDANRSWRISAWGTAIDEAAVDPLTGVGFGRAAAVIDAGDGTLRETDTHNSFIAFGLRFGIIGLLLLLLFEFAVLRAGLRLLRSSVEPRERGLARWLLAAHLLTAFHAMFTVVLEGPYMGLFYWLFGGLLLGFAGSRSTSEAVR